jgi:hypothetical protein
MNNPNGFVSDSIARNWWARQYCGLRALSDTVMEFQGLTIVQVSQNQAAVVSDAHNKIFVVKNSGFVALALTGNYNILTVIDQTHLDTVVKDNVTKAILGWTQEVRMRRNTGSRTGEREFVVALLSVSLRIGPDPLLTFDQS